MIITLTIPIPARENAPATNLHVKVVAEDEASLQTKPYAFMLPGGPGANHSHYKAYECLQDVHNIIFYDPRGCGLSDKGAADTYTMDNYIQDLNVILNYLELQQVTIIGKSYGAICALGYTLRYPNTVEKLVLAAGSPSYKNLETAKINLAKRGTAEQQKICERLWSGTFETDEQLSYYFAIMKPLYSYKARHDQTLVYADYPYSRESLNQGFSTFLHSFDFEEQLSDINCKTLILVGDEDWITDKQHSQLMSQKIPNNQLIIIPQADHKMEEDSPELFFNSIRDFIRPIAKQTLACQFFSRGVEGFNLITTEELDKKMSPHACYNTY